MTLYPSSHSFLQDILKKMSSLPFDPAEMWRLHQIYFSPPKRHAKSIGATSNFNHVGALQGSNNSDGLAVSDSNTAVMTTVSNANTSFVEPSSPAQRSKRKMGTRSTHAAVMELSASDDSDCDTSASESVVRGTRRSPRFGHVVAAWATASPEQTVKSRNSSPGSTSVKRPSNKLTRDAISCYPRLKVCVQSNLR